MCALQGMSSPRTPHGDDLMWKITEVTLILAALFQGSARIYCNHGWNAIVPTVPFRWIPSRSYCWMPRFHSNPSSQGYESCKNIIVWQPVWWQALFFRSKWLWPSGIGPGNTGKRVVIYASSHLPIHYRAPMRNAVCISIFNGWQLWLKFSILFRKFQKFGTLQNAREDSSRV